MRDSTVQDEFDYLVNQGRELIQQKYFYDAIKIFKKIIKHKPAEGWYFIGEARYKLFKEKNYTTDFKEALNSFLTAIKINPTITKHLALDNRVIFDAFYEKMNLLRLENDCIRILPYLDATLLLEPDNQEFLAEKAEMLILIRKFDEAREILNKMSAHSQFSEKIEYLINKSEKFGKNYYVPPHYSKLVQILKNGENVIYSTLANVMQETLNLSNVLREKWTTHVLITQDRILYLKRGIFVTGYWHKMHCKDYGFRFYKIFFRFTNDPRFESSKEISKRKSQFRKEFDSYRLKKLQEYNQNQRQIREKKKLDKLQKKAAKKSKK